jgi:hypothetical protein
MLNRARAYETTTGSSRAYASLALLPGSRADAFAVLYPMALPLLASQLLLVAVTAPWYASYGLHVAWSSAAPIAAAYVALLGGWLYFRRYRHHPTKFVIADAILATGLLLLLTNIVSPAQYLAVAIGRPLVDAQLAHADAVLGFDVRTLAEWTGRHPKVGMLLAACYASLLPQFLLPVLLALRFRSRHDLWEYVFHFHFCLIVTLGALALFPASHAFTYYGFAPTIDQSILVRHLSALRDGTFHEIRFPQIQGLISMPSFHAAGGIMVTWAFRRHRYICVPLVLLNVGLIGATFMTGVHYVVDVLASLVLFAASIGVYRWWAPAHSSPAD